MQSPLGVEGMGERGSCVLLSIMVNSITSFPDSSSNPEALEAVQDGENAFPPRTQAPKGQEEEKASWWPNCTHPRFTKLAVRKFRDRISILWKCRRCPKEVVEVIDIDMNSRNVFVKSTKSALPRRFATEA